MKKLLPLLLALPVPAMAQVLFTGANGASWGVDTNWSTESKPTDTQYASINGNSAGTAVSNGTILVDTNESVGAISFSGSVGKRVSVESGMTLTLVGMPISSVQTLLTNVGNQNFTLTGEGSLSLGGSGVVNVTNANRSVSFNIAVTETGGSRQITKTGAGLFSLHNAAAAESTFSGGIRVEGGTLSVNVSSTGAANAPTKGPLGLGTLTLAEGVTFNYAGSSVGTLHNALSIEGDVSLGTGIQTQRVTWEGDVDLNGATRALSIGQTTIFKGAVSNGALTKTGASELHLAGANSYTGATMINAGKLVLKDEGTLAASSAITLAAGATFSVENDYALAAGQRLSGLGTIEGTFRTGEGTIAPGGESTPGALRVAGNAEFDGGVIELRLGATAWDQLLLEGDAFSLSGNTTGSVTLRLSDFDGSALEGEYLLISTAGLTDATVVDWSAAAFRLDPLPGDWIGSLRMGGDGLYFDLQAIPEPGVPFLLGAAGALLILRRRRSRKGCA